MADPITTNIDNGPVAVGGEIFRNELFTSAGADVLLAGTILARDTSTLKLRLYVKGGSTAGNGVPQFVLTYPVTIAGAGDVPVRVLAAGTVNRDRLVIDADQNANNVDAAVIDLLRSVGIQVEFVEQLLV